MPRDHTDRAVHVTRSARNRRILAQLLGLARDHSLFAPAAL